MPAYKESSMKVGDLKKYLATTGESPEKVAKQAKVSHMTVRRLLKKEDQTAIPEKYWANFSKIILPFPLEGKNFELDATLVAGTSFGDVVQNLYSTGASVRKVGELKKELTQKLRDSRIKGEFLDSIQHISKIAFSRSSPVMAKALCLGALMYLINPFDFIPDAYPVVGYLDDMAILSIVLAYLHEK